MIKFSLSALFIVTLTACGSSGGSSNNNDKPKTPEKTTETSPPTPNNGTIDKQPVPPPAPAPSLINPDANIAAKGLKVGTVTRKYILVDGKGLSVVPLSSLAYVGAPAPDVFQVDMKEEGGQYFGSITLMCTMAKHSDVQLYAFTVMVEQSRKIKKFD